MHSEDHWKADHEFHTCSTYQESVSFKSIYSLWSYTRGKCIALRVSRHAQLNALFSWIWLNYVSVQLIAVIHAPAAFRRPHLGPGSQNNKIHIKNRAAAPLNSILSGLQCMCEKGIVWTDLGKWPLHGSESAASVSHKVAGLYSGLTLPVISLLIIFVWSFSRPWFIFPLTLIHLFLDDSVKPRVF